MYIGCTMSCILVVLFALKLIKFNKVKPISEGYQWLVSQVVYRAVGTMYM